jgi:hypothetical protein
MAIKKIAQETSIALIPIELLEQRIYFLRGQRVMLDADLAEIYGVATKVLNQAVKRNLHRFPEDFMFRLTIEEAQNVIRLRSQIVTLKRGQNIKYAPYAFTGHGAVMLASVLNSPLAIEASIQVVRAFVQMRTVLAVHQDLAKKIEELEITVGTHGKNFEAVFTALRELLKPPKKPRRTPKRQIGFTGEHKMTTKKIKATKRKNK